MLLEGNLIGLSESVHHILSDDCPQLLVQFLSALVQELFTENIKRVLFTVVFHSEMVPL